MKSVRIVGLALALLTPTALLHVALFPWPAISEPAA